MEAEELTRARPGDALARSPTDSASDDYPPSLFLVNVLGTGLNKLISLVRSHCGEAGGLTRQSCPRPRDTEMAAALSSPLCSAVCKHPHSFLAPLRLTAPSSTPAHPKSTLFSFGATF